MRDSFLLRRADLRPIRLDSERDGTHHVHLDYAGNRVTGWKLVKGAKESIDINFDGPVWDSNLWGLTFAALPLKKDAQFHLPTYQYDDGKGSFSVTVTGEKKVPTPGGMKDAWVIRAGVKLNEMADYFIGKNPPAELGYDAGPMSQHPGGDCTGLN